MLPTDAVWMLKTDQVSGHQDVTVRVRCNRYIGETEKVAFLELDQHNFNMPVCIPVEQFHRCDFWPSPGMTFVLRFMRDREGGIDVLGVGEVESHAAH